MPFCFIYQQALLPLVNICYDSLRKVFPALKHPTPKNYAPWKYIYKNSTQEYIFVIYKNKSFPTTETLQVDKSAKVGYAIISHLKIIGP